MQTTVNEFYFQSIFFDQVRRKNEETEKARMKFLKRCKGEKGREETKGEYGIKGGKK